MAASWFSSAWRQSCRSPLLLSVCALACLLTAGLQTRPLGDAQTMTHPRQRRGYRSAGLLNPNPSFPHSDSAGELGPSAQTCWRDCACTPCFSCSSSQKSCMERFARGILGRLWISKHRAQRVSGKSDTAALALLGRDLPLVGGAALPPVPSISLSCAPTLCKPPEKTSAPSHTQEIPTWGTRFYSLDFHSCSCLLRHF